MTVRKIIEAEVAVNRSRSHGRIDLSYEYAVEHIGWASRAGQTPSEVCAALGERRPDVNWETALWLVANYASAAIRAAREKSAILR